MKNIAFMLVILSFLAGAFLASLDERAMNWTYFAPVMLLGFIAAFIYKRESSAAALAVYLSRVQINDGQRVLGHQHMAAIRMKHDRFVRDTSLWTRPVN